MVKGQRLFRAKKGTMIWRTIKGQHIKLEEYSNKYLLQILSYLNPRKVRGLHNKKNPSEHVLSNYSQEDNVYIIETVF